MKKKCDAIQHNNIVKYHNDLNLVQFKDFTTRELNLFYSICAVMRDQDENTITFTFDYLKSLAQIEVQNKTEFVELTKRMYNKLINLKFEYEDEHKFVKFVLFTAFTVEKNEEIVSVKVNPDFKYILNNITSNFTRFELQEYNSLKSKYSKEAYRYIKRFRTTGMWKVDLESFKRIMGLPSEYETRFINRDVISVIESELSSIIKGLKIEKYRKGRSIIGYIFTFKKEAIPKSVKKNEPPVIVTKSAEEIVRERHEKQKKANVYKTKFHNFDIDNSDQYSAENLEKIMKNNK